MSKRVFLVLLSVLVLFGAAYSAPCIYVPSLGLCLQPGATSNALALSLVSLTTRATPPAALISGADADTILGRTNVSNLSNCSLAAGFNPNTGTPYTICTGKCPDGECTMRKSGSVQTCVCVPKVVLVPFNLSNNTVYCYQNTKAEGKLFTANSACQDNCKEFGAGYTCNANCICEKPKPVANVSCHQNSIAEGRLFTNGSICQDDCKEFNSNYTCNANCICTPNTPIVKPLTATPASAKVGSVATLKVCGATPGAAVTFSLTAGGSKTVTANSDGCATASITCTRFGSSAYTASSGGQSASSTLTCN